MTLMLAIRRELHHPRWASEGIEAADCSFEIRRPPSVSDCEFRVGLATRGSSSLTIGGL